MDQQHEKERDQQVPDDARQRANTWWRNYRSHAAEDAKRIGGQVYRYTPAGYSLDKAA